MSEAVGLKELLRRKIEAAYCNDEFTKEAALDYLRQGTEHRHLSSSARFPDLHAPGAKDDKGKPMAGVLLDFSRALQTVVEVGTYGAKKYARQSWCVVVDPDGLDKETGLPHLALVACNALAVLELQARRKETF